MTTKGQAMTQQHSIVTELSKLDDQYLKQLPLHIVTFLSREGTVIRALVNAPGCNGVMLLARWTLQPTDDLSWFVRNSWSVYHDIADGTITVWRWLGDEKHFFERVLRGK